MVTADLNDPAAETATRTVFRCHFCDLEQEVRNELTGRRARCPRCGRVSRVSEPERRLAAAAASSGPEGGTMPRRPASEAYQSQAQTGDREGAKRPIPLGPRGTPPPGAIRTCPHCHKPLEERPGAPTRSSAPLHTPHAGPPSATGEKVRVPPPAALATQGEPRAPLDFAHPEPSSSPPAGTNATAPYSPFAHPSAKTADGPRTRCPYCREEIHAYALKCKHCGEYLEDTLKASRARMLQTVQSSAPQGFSLARLSRRQKIAGGVAALVLLAGLGLWVFRPAGKAGGSGGTRGVGSVDPATAPAIEPLAASLRKALEGTEVSDLAGNLTQFPSAGNGVEPWSAALQNDKGVVHLPFRQISPNPRTPPVRGRIVLEVGLRGRQWEATGVFRTACFRGHPGQEAEIPEEDRQTLRLPNQDAVALRIVAAFRAAAPKP